MKHWNDSAIHAPEWNDETTKGAPTEAEGVEDEASMWAASLTEAERYERLLYIREMI